jgi:two-component system response regulator FlrC
MNCAVKTIILLEDEPLVMKFLRLVLKRFNVIGVTTGEEALQAFDNVDRPVDLLIADVRLARMSGIQVALRIRSKRPMLPVLLMSGYLADGWRDVDAADMQVLGSDSVVFINKPFKTQALLNAVYDLIETPHAEIARTA